MTQSELKQKMFDLVSEYFGGAVVTWGKVRLVSPGVPQVVLTTLPVVRSYHPVTMNAEGVLVNCWPSKIALQVDLYTKGRSLNSDANTTATKENTAVDDLLAFLNFLGSAYVDDWSLINDVSIHTNQVHDLAELNNETSWEYRAMTELELGFTETAVGLTGTNYEGGITRWDNGRPKYEADGTPLDPDGNPVPPELDEDGNPIPWPPLPQFTPTPSGGGTQTLADQSTGWFEAVDGPEQENK